MARKRVVAHFMHEYEAAEVISRLSDAAVTDGLAVGEIDEAEIEGLRAKGIVFQDVEAPVRPELRAAQAAEKVVAAAAEAAAAPSASTASVPGPSRFYYLTLAGPLVDPWRQALQGLGVDIRVALANFTWIARIEAANLAGVRALPFVTNLTMRESDRNLPSREEIAAFGSATGVREAIPYDIVLENGGVLNDMLGWLQAHGVPVAAAEANKVRVYLLEDAARLEEISALTDWVIAIEPYREPQLHNDRARQLLGVDGPPAANPAFRFPLEGDTEIIGVADTGLDAGHPDFAGRVAGLVPLGRPGDPSDPHGHGTHVAGSALGDGAAAAGAIRGTAPRARLFFQSLLDKNGGLGGLPFRLNTLFADAYNNGARIHNNSWGAASAAAYRANSREVDEYAHTQKDMLIVISAGNEGTAADPLLGARNSAPGFVDWLSLGAPATAKNALTVGASRTDRTTGGLAHLTYGAVWGPKFPTPPTSTDTISGDPQSMAAFSSRGPCDDYRIKPDVVAPGTDILSCRSATAPLHKFWGPDPINPKYAYMGGTSMAAPLVSGCAAVVRQYYTQQRAHDPSSALLKATLINSTKWLTGASSVAEFANLPNFHQGFGAVYMPWAVPNSLESGFQLEFYDNWADSAKHFNATGRRRRFSFVLNAGGWLRITLAYVDSPGRALQNNLNLFLQLPNGNKMYGNMNLPLGLNRPDTSNNVETIRIDSAPGGNYLIQVVAANLLTAQDFALVITGPFSGPMTEV
ncbi:MAG: S8 family serine peptidase [Bryobacteraceae bacterium]